MGIIFHLRRPPAATYAPDQDAFRQLVAQPAPTLTWAAYGAATRVLTKALGTRALYGAALLGMLAGCSMFSSSTPIAPSSRGDAGTAMDKAQAQQFTDIPIPAGARMDLDRTLILGPRDSWIGRLVFTSAAAPNDLFEFYNRELPRFGWAGITAVRAGTSVLSFLRGERVATVQISRTTLGGSEVLVTISPHGGMDGNAGLAPSPAAPVTRLRPQPQPLR